MVHLPRAEFNRIARDQRARAAGRKAKRLEKGVALGLRKAPAASQDDQGGSRTPVRVVGQRKRRKPSSRRSAFNRLKASCKLFVLLRAKHRTAGMCEVGILCGGENYATLAYHVIPAATGNSVKYDVRNLVGACSSCNGGEYFDRKRGTYEKWDVRHKEIVGADLLAELKNTAGRRQIGTVEAREMAQALEQRIEKGEWK